MFSVRKAAYPMPMKAANATITRSLRERQNAIRLRSIDDPKPENHIDENRAAWDDKFADSQAAANLSEALLLDPNQGDSAGERRHHDSAGILIERDLTDRR